MSDIKLFRLQNHKAAEIAGTASHLEKPLQSLIESNLEPLLGIRLVATEYPTGKTHSGRIDTLGLDENLCPVILEYLHINPDQHPHLAGFTRDVRKIGHLGTGDLELNLARLADVERAKPYLTAAYHGGADASQAKLPI